MQISPNLVWTINSELQLRNSIFQFSNGFIERNLEICENAYTYSAWKNIPAIKIFNSLAEQRAAITFSNPNRSVNFFCFVFAYSSESSLKFFRNYILSIFGKLVDLEVNNPGPPPGD